jgi:hypothetical protein
MLNASGAVLSSITTATPNTYTTYPFVTRSRKVAALTLTGGNNEGILKELCIKF